MAYDFKPFERKIAELVAHVQKELAGVRTGRATSAILDGVQVESYGSRMSLPQVANITVEDARTLRIAPYDSALGKEIEKAVIQANLGLSVGIDERGVRVSFPELTADRRISLVKLAKEKIEDCRGRLRIARDEVWSAIQKLEKEGAMSEDDKFRTKDEMQKRVDAVNAQFEALLDRKEKEIAS